MQINLSVLKKNLPNQSDYLQRYTPGLFRAIEAAHYQTKSTEVNWDEFTLEDAEKALDMAMNYVDTEYADEDSCEGPPNEGNAIHEYLLNGEIIYALKKAEPEKQTENVDFF
jgi:hypothetical protein